MKSKTRPGWLATAAFGAFLGALGCASTPRSEPVSTVTTTSAATTGPVQGGRCSPELGTHIEFPPRGADIPAIELPELDRWARCLNERELEHTTVVLVGKDERNGKDGLFLERAQQVRTALIARGVDARRILVAESDATGGGPFANPTMVRIEVTHLQTIKAFAPHDPAVRRALH